MSRIWVKTMKRQRIQRQTTVECSVDGVEDALREVCRELDIPSPMWLDKQRDELDKFGMTSFDGGSFFESISFDRLEVNLLSDDGTTRRSRDPRNDFSDSFY